MKISIFKRRYIVIIALISWTAYSIYMMHYWSIHGFTYNRYGNQPGEFSFFLKRMFIHFIILTSIILVKNKKKKYWYLGITILTLIFFALNLVLSMHSGSVMGVYLTWLLGVLGLCILLTIASFLKDKKLSFKENKRQLKHLFIIIFKFFKKYIAIILLLVWSIYYINQIKDISPHSINYIINIIIHSVILILLLIIKAKQQKFIYISATTFILLSLSYTLFLSENKERAIERYTHWLIGALGLFIVLTLSLFYSNKHNDNKIIA